MASSSSALPSTMSYSDAGPLKPHMFFPMVGFGTGSQMVVPFNHKISDQINRLFLTNPMVSTAVNQLTSYVMRSKIEFEGVGAKVISELQIEREIIPAITQMVREWLLYGYTTIGVGESRVEENTNTLVVLPRSRFRQAIRWNKFYQTEYIVQAIADPTVEIPNTKVLCMFPPDDNGVLTSPIAFCRDHLSYAEKLWNNYITGTDRSVNPPLIFTQERVTGSVLPGIDRSPLSTSIITSNGIGQLPMSQVIDRSERDILEHDEKVLAAAKEQRAKSIAEQKQTKAAIKSSDTTTLYDVDSTLPAAVRASLEVDPVSNLYIAPVGHSLSSGPEFKTPADFIKVINTITEELYRAIGLPTVMIHDRGDNSSNVEFAMTHLHRNVVRFQAAAATLVSEALDMVFSGKFAEERLKEQLTDEIVALSNGDEVDEIPEQKDYKAQFRVRFISNPDTTLPMAHQMYLTGAITADAFQEIVADISSLPATALRPNMEEWLSNQEKKNTSKERIKRQRTE